jgi:cytidylate kinase
VNARRPIIAIDGPAGAGKSTAARNLAAALGFVYLDTGATFRAVALQALREGVPLDREEALLAMAERCDITFAGERFDRIFLNGEDVSRSIREPPIALASSQVAVHPRVRALLVHLWRKIAAQGGVILEGRDIGTNVFPDAELKFFLEADQAERASRRLAEREGERIGLTLEGVKQELSLRDETDRRRAHSPLRKADDAVVIDTTHLSPAETLAILLERARERLQIPRPAADLT